MSPGLRTPSSGRIGSTWRRLQRTTLERDSYICRLTLDGCTGHATCADHWIPRSIAPHLAEDPTNLNAACRNCNRLKADLMPAEAIRRYRTQPANGTRNW